MANFFFFFFAFLIQIFPISETRDSTTAPTKRLGVLFGKPRRNSLRDDVVNSSETDSNLGSDDTDSVVDSIENTFSDFAVASSEFTYDLIPFSRTSNMTMHKGRYINEDIKQDVCVSFVSEIFFFPFFVDRFYRGQQKNKQLLEVEEEGADDEEYLADFPIVKDFISLVGFEYSFFFFFHFIIFCLILFFVAASKELSLPTPLFADLSVLQFLLKLHF